MRNHWILISCFLPSSVLALEGNLKGIIDLRVSHADGLQSYVSGGQGKLQHSSGSDLSLGQLGLAGGLELSDSTSMHAVINGFADSDKDRLGFTELYLKYRTLPDTNGFRNGIRLGVFYPAISMENHATAWSTPNTLTPSTMNSWIGEELRATGFEYTAEWLGKFREADFDLKLNATLFLKNDTAGSMISWHGWTQSSRQTVIGERLPLPYTPALDADLSDQSRNSDPFHEEDSRPGYMTSIEWKLHKRDLLQFGYFDSNTNPFSVTNGQYGWDTRFLFGGFQWNIDRAWSLQGQIMQGNTLMQSPGRVDVVNNDYRSAYVSLGWRKGPHRVNTRLEEFSVIDLDNTLGDNNSEYGKAITLTYRYRMARQWFVLGEYSWINSDRAARIYTGDDSKQIERQLQAAVRYYF